jgi:predicted acyltransferase
MDPHREPVRDRRQDNHEELRRAKSAMKVREIPRTQGHVTKRDEAGVLIPAPGARLTGLDLFRGLTVAAMILVNNPGDWNHVWAPLTHADWNGWTFADLIFPSFLFIVGTAGVLSLQRRRTAGASGMELARHALRRGALIMLVGWLIAAFPFTPDSIVHLRIPGVLPRIGLVFILCTWIILAVRDARLIPLVILALLAVHTWLLTAIGYDLTPGGNVQLAVDRALFGSHMWQDGGDPEGIVSTLSATATMLTGALAAYLLISRVEGQRKTLWLFTAGGLGLLLGGLWSAFLPINKHLWTGSFVLLSSGAAAILLAVCSSLGDIHFLRRPLSVLATFGKNPLAAFVFAELLGKTMHIVPWHNRSENIASLRTFLFEGGFAWLHHPTVASHLFALSIVILLYLTLREFEVRSLYWKIS